MTPVMTIAKMTTDIRTSISVNAARKMRGRRSTVCPPCAIIFNFSKAQRVSLKYLMNSSTLYASLASCDWRQSGILFCSDY
jgi:hypothetical protein